MTNDFDKGVANAAAWLIDAHGIDRVALEMIYELGISLETVCPEDLKVIQDTCAKDVQYGIIKNKVVRIGKP